MLNSGVLLLFQGTNEILRLFVALQGVQHAGKTLKELLKSVTIILAFMVVKWDFSSILLLSLYFLLLLITCKTSFK